MGSVTTITLYADSPDQAQRAFVAAFRRIEELNGILSDYNPQSELSRACETAGPLSADLLNIIEFSQRLSATTDGAFDITVGPLTHLWRAARKEKRLPSEAELKAALSRTGYRRLTVLPDERKIQCSVPGMQLDAGGIAKGYAADEAIRTLRQMGIQRALVAMSGDIVCSDPPPDKSGWVVSVGGKHRLLKNGAVSTSGDDFQFLEIGGERYSHIIDPRTGMPLRNSRTVSVVAPTGMEADALATAASVGGAEAVTSSSSSK